MYLEKINGPEDIKKLKKEQLQTLADETRNALINKISNVTVLFSVAPFKNLLAIIFTSFSSISKKPI